MTATLTDRYVAAVLRALPEQKRADIEKELRASIADAVDARVGNGEPEADAERAVLRDLGEPERLAAGYAGRPLSLIGPKYFVDYVRLLKVLYAIVLPIATAAVLLATVLGGAAIGEAIGTTVAAAIGIAVHLGFWTTLVFAILERTNSPAPLTAFDPDDLPYPAATGAPPLSDFIVTAVAALFAVGAIVWQQLSSVFLAADGSPIPMLNPALWTFWLPYFFAVLALTVVHAAVLYRTGRWTVALAVTSGLLNLAGAVPLIVLIATGRLFNPEFFARFEWDGVVAPGGVGATWTVVALVVITLWAIVDGAIKTRRSAGLRPVVRDLAGDLKAGVRGLPRL